MDFTSAFGIGCGGPGIWHGSTWMGGFSFPFGGIIQLLIIGLIVYFIVRTFHHPATNTGAPSPHDVLKRRYAAGEIDQETFARMKEELK